MRVLGTVFAGEIAVTLSLVGLLAGCGAEEPPPDLRQPAGWDDALRLPEPRMTTAPNVVEVHLEAKVTEIEVVPGSRPRYSGPTGMLP